MSVDYFDATIILAIVLVSGFLGFWQERGAVDAVEKLYAIVQIKTTVVRNGDSKEVPIEEVVPGDIVFSKASDVVPGDCLLLKSKDLFVDEAALTGETYPAGHWPDRSALYHCSRGGKKILLQKGKFLKR